MALWDIKGKALGVIVHQLLGGPTRDHLECYSTGFPRKGSLKETAQACLEAGFRVYRTGAVGEGRDSLFNSRMSIEKTYDQCREIREGVGRYGNWAIDFHTRYEMNEAVTLCNMIEPCAHSSLTT